MGILDRLFRTEKIASVLAEPPPKAAAASPKAPGTSIGYDDGLIVGFKGDHRLLLDIWAKLDAAVTAGNLRQVEVSLDHFRKVLMDHLLKENVRLYVYLEHMLKDDLTSHHLIHEFRHEMDDIGKVVLGFLTRYKSISSQPELAASLASDMKNIGAALVDRIQREEATLYPLYAPAA